MFRIGRKKQFTFVMTLFVSYSNSVSSEFGKFMIAYIEHGKVLAADRFVRKLDGRERFHDLMVLSEKQDTGDLDESDLDQLWTYLFSRSMAVIIWDGMLKDYGGIRGVEELLMKYQLRF